MINNVFVKIIEFFIQLLKKTNLDQKILDKIIFNIGIKNILINRKSYSNIKNLQDIAPLIDEEIIKMFKM